MNRGLLFVVSAPSGCGKDTLLRRVCALYGDVCVSVSATTRPMRAGETEGEDYFFVSRERFAEMISNGELLEYAEYNGNYYGTVRSHVERLMAQGKHVILIIEVQGAALLRAKGLFLTTIFLLPPSRAELLHRLRKRSTDTEQEIANRLAIADGELRQAAQYDYLLVNGDLDTAAVQLHGILDAQRYRRENMQSVWEEVMSHAEV